MFEELYCRYCEGLDENEMPMTYEEWLAWTSQEEEEDYEEYEDLEYGFDPYCGCYTYDC